MATASDNLARLSDKQQPLIADAAAIAPRGVLPAGLPTWITAEAIEDTVRTFQPFYPDMKLEDAISILLAAGNLFDVLKDEAA